MKIAVYTIALNEEKHVKRWYESAKDADLLLIADTGSTDRTVEIAESLGIAVHRINVDPWRFDIARNTSLQLIPEHYDWCINLDMDEVLTPGWREQFDSVPTNATRLRYRYFLGVESLGNPTKPTFGDKIHRRLGYKWKRPVHETLWFDGKEIEHHVNFEVHHIPDLSKSRHQYLPLLELAHNEDPMDSQICFWLGREFLRNGKRSQAEATLLRFLELDLTWAVERMAAMVLLSNIQDQKSEYWLLRSVAESPFRRESWMALADFYQSKKRWHLSLAAAQAALEIHTRPIDYLSEERNWGYHPYDVAALSAYSLGLHELAVDYGNKAVECSTSNLRLNQNLVLYLKAFLQ